MDTILFTRKRIYSFIKIYLFKLNLLILITYLIIRKDVDASIFVMINQIPMSMARKICAICIIRSIRFPVSYWVMSKYNNPSIFCVCLT